MKNRKKTEQSTSTPIILIFWQAVQNDRYATKTGPFVLATLHINAEQAHKDIPKILAQGKYRPHIMLGKKNGGLGYELPDAVTNQKPSSLMTEANRAFANGSYLEVPISGKKSKSDTPRALIERLPYKTFKTVLV